MNRIVVPCALLLSLSGSFLCGMVTHEPCPKFLSDPSIEFSLCGFLLGDDWLCLKHVTRGGDRYLFVREECVKQEEDHVQDLLKQCGFGAYVHTYAGFDWLNDPREQDVVMHFIPRHVYCMLRERFPLGKRLVCLWIDRDRLALIREKLHLKLPLLSHEE